jgi:hypothetical protein
MESRWTPETSESDCRGQTSMDCGVLYIIGKLLKHRYLKWARIAHLDIWNISYGQKKGRESNSRESASFDSRPLKVGNRPEILGCRERATYRWKGFDEIYNFAWDGKSIGGLLRKLWSFKVAGVPSLRDFGTPTRESQESWDKMAIWMPPPWRVIEYTIRGKWLASPRGGKMLASPPREWGGGLLPSPECVCVQSESEFTRGLSQHQKGSMMSSKGGRWWFPQGPGRGSS